MSLKRASVLICALTASIGASAAEFTVYTGEGEYPVRGSELRASKSVDEMEPQWDPGALDPASWSRYAHPVRDRELKISPLLRATLAQTGGSRRSKAIDGSADRIALQIRASASVDLVRSEIERRHGVVLAVVDSVVFADLPASAISELSQHPSVAFVAESTEYRPRSAEPASGAELMEVGLLRRAGLSGAGVRVGIIDLGFQQYSQLQSAGVVPTPLATASFVAQGRPGLDIEQQTHHGSACAEIIHQIAPESELLLARFDGRDSTLIQAVRWLVEQKVDIISASFGANVKALDGRDVIDRFVDQITREHGVLFVVAAGNEAQNIWSGPVTDRNHNSMVDVSLGRKQHDLIAVTGSGGPWTLAVHWDDWGKDPSLPSSTQDIDAFLLVPGKNGKPRVIAASTNPQNGRQQPVEVFRGDSWPRGSVAFLALRMSKVNRDLKVHVVPVLGLKIVPTETASSISSPATATSAMAVGAVDVATGKIADYSSHGPTDDGRVKPDMVAPAGIRSQAYRNSGGVFHGTSAAAPHAAAFAALLRQGNPQLSGEALKAATITAVQAITGPSPNNAYGYGLPKGSLALNLFGPPTSAPQVPSIQTPEPATDPQQAQIQKVIEELLRKQQEQRNKGD